MRGKTDALAMAISTTIEDVTASEIERFAEEHPRSSAWTDVWVELRQVFGPCFGEAAMHQSRLVVCTRNRRTQRTTERVAYVGTGDCPVCTLTDLVTQHAAEQRPFESSSELDPESDHIEFSVHGSLPVRIAVQGETYPLGIFGRFVHGIA